MDNVTSSSLHVGSAAPLVSLNMEIDSHPPSPLSPESDLIDTGVMALTLSWHNVSYSIKQKNGDSKWLLTGMSGSVGPGELIALMGTSGAGKTTFLNLLSGRNLGNEGHMEGDIKMNGNKRDKTFRRVSGYVEQEDALLPFLTVEETFMFHAYLRLPAKWTAKAKKARSRTIMNELGLGHCKTTLIGNYQLKGISGGEKKRVAIGIELITNPKLLFLDEPTSGLDAFTACHVMKAVRLLASNGRAIIVTIHQPRANIYELFDKLLLLSRGETVYYGPAAEARDWFAMIGFPCGANNNPADHFLDITTIDGRSPILEETTTQRNQKMIQEYSTSKYSKFAAIEATCTTPSPVLSHMELVGRLPFYLQFTYLWRRSLLNFFRNRKAVVAEFGQNIFVSLLTGSVFFGLSQDQNGIQNRNGALFFLTLMFSFNPCLAAIQTFQIEKPVFLRERSGKLYEVLPYYVARSSAVLPIQLLFPMMVGTIVYWMIGLNPLASRYFFFLLVCVIQYFTAQGIGIVLSAATRPDIAAALAPVVVICFMLFGGFYLNLESIWVGFIWIEKISFITYCWRAFMINEFEGLTFKCDIDGTRCQSSGDQVLRNFDIDDLGKWVNIAVLFSIAIFIRMLGYLVLRFASKPRTRLH